MLTGEHTWQTMPVLVEQQRKKATISRPGPTAENGTRGSRIIFTHQMSRWPTVDVSVGDIMSKMYICMVEKGYVSVKGMKSRSECIADYKGLRKRIYSASVGRAMFVTSKGFISLAPWNAQQGDVVNVLFGGWTPFILRKTTGEEKYALVGEAYVFGIMGGELFGGGYGGEGMGHARLRDFDIV